MPNRIRNILFVIIGLICSISSYAQYQDYFGNTIVVKLKTSNFSNGRAAGNRVFNQLQVTEYGPMFSFSNSNSPHRKRHTVDLSKIYEIKYAANISKEEAIQLLMSTGLYEYAEPRYADVPMYQPNDPKADSTLPASGGNFRQNYLLLHKLYQAWDVTKGDSNIVIGITDTGFMYDHEDLGNISFNHNDSINGVDDDGDMALDSLLLDNFRGWDVSDWDNDATFSTDGHGVEVAGCSSGSCDNGVGICGTGFYCSYLPIKVSHDTTNSVISEGYTGIIYGAEQGCDILNLSWASSTPDFYFNWQQEVINYAAIDFDVTVVAAAGNTGGHFNFYPASYDNVLSVATSKNNKKIATTTTYSYHVDVNALGVNAHTARPFGTSSYGPITGSSYATPIVSGIAGLIRAHRPELNGLQVAELIRVTGEVNDTLPGNEAAFEKIGRLVNAYNAVINTESPSIRALNYQLEDMDTIGYTMGDTLLLVMDFKNFLTPTSDLSVSITVESGNADVIVDSIALGRINTLDTVSIATSPFIIATHPGRSVNEELLVRVQYTDGAYNDYQYLSLSLNDALISPISNHTYYTSSQLTTCLGTLTFSGDSVSMVSKFLIGKNDLDNIQGSITPITSGVNISSATASFGSALAFDTIENTNAPFKFYLGAGFAQGDTITFQFDMSSDTYSDSYEFEYIIDTNSLLAKEFSFINTNNTFGTSSGTLSLSGDTIFTTSKVLNKSCSTGAGFKLITLSNDIDVIDSLWNESEIAVMDTVNNAGDPYSFYLPPTASDGDSIYFKIQYTVNNIIEGNSDSILFVVNNTDLVVTNLIPSITQQNIVSSVVPNPFDDDLKIIIHSNGLATDYVLYDELLRSVRTGTIYSSNASEQITINTENLSTGFYLLLIRQGDKVEKIKLVKTGQ